MHISDVFHDDFWEHERVQIIKMELRIFVGKLQIIISKVRGNPLQAPNNYHLCLCRLLICAQHAIWREKPGSRVRLIKQSSISQFYTRHLQKDIIIFGCLVSLGVTSLSREKILASARSDSHCEMLINIPACSVFSVQYERFFIRTDIF